MRVFDQSVPRWSGHLNGQHPGQFSQTHGGGWALPGNHCVPGRYALLHDPNGLGPFAVPNAVSAIRDVAHWTTSAHGGRGAVREFCDRMLAWRGQLAQAAAVKPN